MTRVLPRPVTSGARRAAPPGAAVPEAARRPGRRRLVLPAIGGLVLAGLTPVAAQAPPPLTLPDAIERALARHPDLLLQRDAIAAAEQGERRARGAYDLLVRIDGRGRVRTDPVNSILSGAPDGALAPRTTSILGSASAQQLFAGGASLLASTSVSRDTSNGRLALLTPAWLSALSVEFRQPLLQGRRIDAPRRALKVAAVDRARTTAQLGRIANDLVSSVERAYWTLVAARRDLAVRRRTVALAERQLEDARARLAAGTAAEADLSPPQAEIARRRGEVFAAEEAEARAAHALRALVAASPEDPAWQAPIATQDPLEEPAPPPALDEALSLALASRPEIDEARTAIDRQQVEIEAARDRLRPSLDLVAGYALRGLAGERNAGAIPIGGLPIVVEEAQDGALPRSWATLFTHRFADVSLGVSYAIPIGRTVARTDVALAEIGRRQAETALTAVRQRIAVDVRNAIAALSSARDRVATARAGREAAGEQLAAEQHRYDAGLTTSFFVLTRQNDLALAELAETAALVDSQKARAEFLRATGTLLARRGITLTP